MKSEPRLTVELGNDARIDEYRVRDRHVEFRARRPDGEEFPGWSGGWRQLTADDISLHVALRTPVGEWLMLRLFR